MLYIIGIDHLVQYNGPVPSDLLGEFKEYIDLLITNLEIDVIAEEFNEEFLVDVYGATEDTAKSAAEKAGIEHIYCDPDSYERAALGIPYYADVADEIKLRHNISDKFISDPEIRKIVNSEVYAEVKKYWELRENFWYEKIKDRLHQNILFLCGHEHVYRFKELLAAYDIESEIINEYWKREIFSNYSEIGLR